MVRELRGGGVCGVCGVCGVYGVWLTHYGYVRLSPLSLSSPLTLALVLPPLLPHPPPSLQPSPYPPPPPPRRKFIDGRGVRLPTVVVRAGAPNAATTGCFSGVIREPLAGKGEARGGVRVVYCVW